MPRIVHILFIGVLTAGIAAAAVPGEALAEDRALLIGLDSYADAKLGYDVKGAAANDLAAIGGLLTAKLGYGKAQVKVLADKAATKAAILDGVADWLGKGTKPGERAYLYFAGHGYFAKDTNGDEADGLDEALVPFGAKVSGTGPKAAIDGLISDDEFATAIKALDGRHVTIVLDTSHSGTVTRAKGGAKTILAARTPQFAGATRSIVVEPAAQAQKSEGGFVEATFAAGSLTVWSAASASQAALINTDDPAKPAGVFTKLYVAALAGGKADRNANGTVSNAELLQLLSAGAGAYCKAHGSRCEMGLTPRLDPAPAHGLAALTKGGVVKPKLVAAPEGGGAPKGGGVALTGSKLTIDKVTDLLAQGNTDKVVVEQIPPSPVHVGAKNIRFRVVSPHGGHLVLLNLNDDGKLIQLYPNQFSRKYETEHTGRLLAGSPLTVPDDYYGLRFNASAPSKGYVIALVTRDPVDFGVEIKTRAIEVIPHEEAVDKVLPKLAAALGTPANTGAADKNTAPVRYSVATLRYEILP